MTIDPFAYYRNKGILPDRYEEGMNCFVDSIPDHKLRQATYEELLKMPDGAKIDPTGEAGSLFGVNFKNATDGVKKAAQRLGKPGLVAYTLEKKALVRMALERADIELTFFTHVKLPSGRTGQHAERAKVTDIVLDSQPFFERALEYHKQGKTDQALDWYIKAIKKEPLDARAWLNKGAILSNLKQYDQANRCFDEVIDIAPGMAGGAGYINKAMIMYQIENWNEVINYYDKAFEINAYNAQLLHKKATALAKIGRFDEAVKFASKAVELDPKQSTFLVTKADCLYFIKKYGEAIECCNKVLNVDPRNAEAWNIKGLAHAKIGKHKEAINCYDKALNASPKFDEVWLI